MTEKLFDFMAGEIWWEKVANLEKEIKSHSPVCGVGN